MVRLTARTAARLASPKTRKGTRHWQAAYDTDLRVGVKEINVEQAVDVQRWQEESEQAAYPLVAAAATTTAAALLADFGSPDMPVADIVAAIVTLIVTLIGMAAATQALRLARLLRQRDSEGVSMQELQQTARDYASTLTSWTAATATRAATATINGARATAAQAWTDAAPGRTVVGMWNTRQDSLVRPSHVLAQSQKRPVGESFRVGESWLRFPGDPDGPPHEIYGCRCWLSHRSTVTGRFVPTPEGARTRMTRSQREEVAS
jgi:hypothetical protein